MSDEAASLSTSKFETRAPGWSWSAHATRPWAQDRWTGGHFERTPRDEPRTCKISELTGSACVADKQMRHTPGPRKPAHRRSSVCPAAQVLVHICCEQRQGESKGWMRQRICGKYQGWKTCIGVDEVVEDAQKDERYAGATSHASCDAPHPVNEM